jgi:catechol 2,3-dioxygenase-like lactoylglutathione lyase family enzyme
MMKRLHVLLHVHVSVDDLSQSIRFYSTLFAAEPTVLKPDYAKWMLEDPRVNFAISLRQSAGAGISHLGIQAEDETELYDRLSRAERPIVEADLLAFLQAQHRPGCRPIVSEGLDHLPWCELERHRGNAERVIRLIGRTLGASRDSGS